MGLSPFKSCSTSLTSVAPNPSPSMYKVLERKPFKNSTLLKVKYIGCTNFEGEKILIFMGGFFPKGDLDPHFSEDDKSPIARFRPDALGMGLAIRFCESLD